MAGDEDEVDPSATRYPVMPSLVALQYMRNHLALAQLGRKLMKWMALALGRELRVEAAAIIQQSEKFGEHMRMGFIALARCRYFNHVVNPMVMNNLAEQAHIRLETSTKQVCSVRLRVYEAKQVGPIPCEHLCLSKGGIAVRHAREVWMQLTKILIQAVESRKDFTEIETAYRAANKKSKVLGKIVIPKTLATISYILAELEERAREDFFRMKKIIQVKNKIKDKKKAAVQIKDEPDTITLLEPELDEICERESPCNIGEPFDEPCIAQESKYDNNELGTIINEVHTVTKIIRTMNNDGSIKEEKKVTVIKKKVLTSLKDDETRSYSSKNNDADCQEDSCDQKGKNKYIGILTVSNTGFCQQTQCDIDQSTNDNDLSEVELNSCTLIGSPKFYTGYEECSVSNLGNVNINTNKMEQIMQNMLKLIPNQDPSKSNDRETQI